MGPLFWLLGILGQGRGGTGARLVATLSAGCQLPSKATWPYLKALAGASRPIALPVPLLNGKGTNVLFPHRASWDCLRDTELAAWLLLCSWTVVQFWTRLPIFIQSSCP